MVRIRGIGSEKKVFGIIILAALLLLAGVGIMGSSLTGYTGETYLFLVLVALVPQVLGHSILNWSLARNV